MDTGVKTTREASTRFRRDAPNAKSDRALQPVSDLRYQVHERVPLQVSFCRTPSDQHGVKLGCLGLESSSRDGR